MPLRSTVHPPAGERLGGGALFGRSAVAALVLSAALAGCKEAARTGPHPVASERGRQLFKERCAACHPNGGNVISPKKTLHGGVLAENGITTPDDIINKMRNPGPGMARFDQATIPDADARLIAEYVLATYR